MKVRKEKEQGFGSTKDTTSKPIVICKEERQEQDQDESKKRRSRDLVRLKTPPQSPLSSVQRKDSSRTKMKVRKEKELGIWRRLKTPPPSPLSSV
jgi:hypothetical protein